MGIEKQPLRLRPHQAADMPAEFRDLHSLVMRGFPLSQVAQGLKLSPQDHRFAQLSRYLIFLSDRGLLIDPAAQRLADSLRPDHTWPESLVFDEIFGIELFRLRKTLVYSSEKMLTVSNVLVVGAYGVYQMLKSTRTDFSNLTDESAWRWLMIFVIIFALGKSARALAQMLVMRMITGFPAALRLRVDQVSVSLATDDLSLSRGGEAALWGGLGSLLWLALPIAIFSQSADLPIATFFLQLLLLTDLSPFVHSGLTEWLRLLYNFISTPDRTDEESETLFRNIHLTVGVIWTIAFVAFLVFTGASAFRHLLNQLDLHDLTAKIGAVVLALSQGIILVSLFNDLLVSLFTQDDRGRMLARLWRRRPASLSVDEAIAQGRTPIRAELAKLPLLRQLDSELREELLAKARVVDLKPGELACRQGGTDRSLFILLSGEMAVAKTTKGRRRVVALLESGAIFGEAAFFLGQTRTADVVAIEACQLLEIQHHPSMRAMDQERSEELRSRIWFLQALVSSAAFRTLPSEALDALIFAGRERRLPAATHVMSEGQDGDACYFIVQGQGTVTQNGRVINKVKAGDVVGEIALLKPFLPRTATVTADSEMITIAVTIDDFWELLSAHLPLAIEIERVAEARLYADRAKSQTQAGRSA